jgi:DNA-binding NtrC family response regulator
MEMEKKIITQKGDWFDALQKLYDQTKGILNRETCSRENLIDLFQKANIPGFWPEEVPATISLVSTSLIRKALNFDDIQVANKFFDIFYQDMKDHGPFTMTGLAMEIEGMGDLVFLKHKETRKRLDRPFHPSEEKFLNEVFQISQIDTPLLIIGETGTSKQFLAKAIHRLSNRRKKEFNQINCTAVTETIFESELFGYEKGAFTGALGLKKGLLEEANEGTFFLDEIGKMPDHLQAKILKVIDEQEIRRVGSTKPIKINVRFIAAAQPEDLKKIIYDLRNRLGFPDCIEMPTLMERFKMDPVGHIDVIDNVLKEAKRGIKEKESITISKESYTKLLNHEYKGNYRELVNILRAAIRNAHIEKRTEIIVKDLEEVMEKTKRFYKEQEEGSVDGGDFEDISLKDILDYAEEKRASIIENKIKQILQNGKSLKSEFNDEKDYLNFRKKVVRIIGKKIRELQL